MDRTDLEAALVRRVDEDRIAFKIVMNIQERTGKPTVKRPLVRPRLRWEDNIRMYLDEICINAWNWVDAAQDGGYWIALVNAALNLRVP